MTSAYSKLSYEALQKEARRLRASNAALRQGRGRVSPEDRDRLEQVLQILQGLPQREVYAETLLREVLDRNAFQ